MQNAVQSHLHMPVSSEMLVVIQFVMNVSILYMHSSKIQKTDIAPSGEGNRTTTVKNGSGVVVFFC